MLTLIFIEFVGTTPLVINFLVLSHLPHFCKEKNSLNYLVSLEDEFKLR